MARGTHKSIVSRPPNVRFGTAFEIRPVRSPQVHGGVIESLPSTSAAQVGTARHPVLTDINVARSHRARNRVAESPASRVCQRMDCRPCRRWDCLPT